MKKIIKVKFFLNLKGLIKQGTPTKYSELIDELIFEAKNIRKQLKKKKKKNLAFPYKDMHYRKEQSFEIAY